jgi:hypothetical protein
MKRLHWAGQARIVLATIAVVAGAVLGAAAALAQSLMSETEARREMKESYDVQVLNVKQAEQDGVPVFIVKVMNTAGNYNEAFQVNVLVMDRRNGKLVPQFRHTTTGVTGAGNGPRDIDEDIGPDLRERSTEGRRAQ